MSRIAAPVGEVTIPTRRGNTGNGREAGIDAIHDYMRTKTVWINTSDAPIADPFIMR